MSPKNRVYRCVLFRLRSLIKPSSFAQLRISTRPRMTLIQIRQTLTTVAVVALSLSVNLASSARRANAQAISAKPTSNDAPSANRPAQAITAASATAGLSSTTIDASSGVPCAFPPCDPASAMLFSSPSGVVDVQHSASFVSIFVANQPHVAWLIEKQSMDPRYLLFEESHIPPTRVRHRWAVEKCASCGCHGHQIWYRAIGARPDDDNWRNWQFIGCAHLTCMNPDAVPFPAGLGKRPPPPAPGAASGPGATPESGEIPEPGATGESGAIPKPGTAPGRGRGRGAGPTGDQYEPPIPMPEPKRPKTPKPAPGGEEEPFTPRPAAGATRGPGESPAMERAPNAAEEPATSPRK